MFVWHKPNSLFYQMMLSFIILSAFLIRVDAANANASNAAQQHMGEVLFAFYQGDHYGALVQQSLLDKEPHDQLSKEQQQQLALLKGGLSLSYGLTQQAQQVFEALLNQQSGTSTQAMAWFWLGKIHYQQNDYRRAEAAFSQLKNKKIRKKLDNEQQQEMQYMQAQIALNLGVDDIEQHITELDKQSIYRAYINFNRGVDLLDGGQREQGLAWLQQAYQVPENTINRSWLSRWFTPSEEQLFAEHQALNDRIQLALGYGFMQADQPVQAVAAFTQVHAQSLDTHAAMLGYGWALAQQKDFEKALSVWHQLIKQPDAGLYAYEAMLASAYAFEQVDANIQAMDALNNAQVEYERRLSDINTIQQEVSQADYFQPFIQGLAARYKTQDRKRFSVSDSVDALPAWIDNAMAIQLWSQPDTNKLIQQLIDIETQLERLAQWREDISHYHLLIDERETEALRRNEQVVTQDFEQQLQVLANQVRELSQRINLAEQQQSPALLADEQNLTHQQRLNKAVATYNQLTRLKELAPAYADRLKRLQGVVDWRLSEAFPNNLWQSRKQLAELGKLLADAEQNKQRLLTAMDRRADFAIKRRNIDELGDRISQQVASTELLKQSLLDKLVEKNATFLTNEKSQLKQYLYQVQLSKLRIQDSAYDTKSRLDNTSVQPVPVTDEASHLMARTGDHHD
jgi:SOS-response transcriptional repressor LexA